MPVLCCIQHLSGCCCASVGQEKTSPLSPGLAVAAQQVYSVLQADAELCARTLQMCFTAHLDLPWAGTRNLCQLRANFGLCYLSCRSGRDDIKIRLNGFRVEYLLFPLPQTHQLKKKHEANSPCSRDQQKCRCCHFISTEFSIVPLYSVRHSQKFLSELWIFIEF